MAGSTFGTLFRVTTWGESHGSGIGAVIDGVPSGILLSETDIQPFLDRRRPGKNRYATARQEMDQVRILSGIFEGKTTGTPVSVMISNTDQHSADYRDIAGFYRPGHADMTYDMKYGFYDYRGGGRSSGRETAARTAAGAVASKILAELGIRVRACVTSAGPFRCRSSRPDFLYASKSPLCMPEPEIEKQSMAFLEECIAQGTSCGGTVTCIASSVPPGLGEPVFGKLDAVLGQGLFSIGAVKAVEIGSGVGSAEMRGHENNDQFCLSDSGKPVKCSNFAGGILGGISDGSDIVIRVTFKPTPSISQPQMALYRDGSVREAVIRGRHDPFIPARAAVVVESMTAIVLLDLLLQNMSSTMEGIRSFYTNK